MGPNPVLGVIFHWIAGFASATNFIPFRGIRRWSFEVFWIIHGVAAWLIAPLLIASFFIPHVLSIIAAAPRSALHDSFLYGVLWGISGLTFGLAVRYLGIALGYSIVLGLSIVVGTLVPPVSTGAIHAVLHERSGLVILLGLAVCLLAVAINGAAGRLKERETSPLEKAEAGESDFSFTKGIAVALFAGVMSSFFAFGLKAGEPVAAIARTRLLRSGHLDLWSNLPVLIVVLWGGFVTNLVWSVALILRNRSAAQFLGAPGRNPMRATDTTGETLAEFDPRDPAHSIRLAPSTLLANYLFAALAGLIWYLQFVFYSMGQTRMGRYDVSSWTLHMASIILFATLWGLVLHEWRGTSRRTRLLVSTGLVLLLSSTLIVGYGNYLKAAGSHSQATTPSR